MVCEVDMSSTARGILYVLGFIAAVYLLFQYVLPLLFSFLGVALTIIIKVVMWLALIVGFVVLVSYIVQYFKNRG
jgi:hypothetical protein